ncbi:MAG: hypothetical protein IIZ75_01910, partial [Lachnospiraceae bacterium]|nr:hypothetical protein [Lachnospiraceae bacterium]
KHFVRKMIRRRYEFAGSPRKSGKRLGTARSAIVIKKLLRNGRLFFIPHHLTTINQLKNLRLKEGCARDTLDGAAGALYEQSGRRGYERAFRQV